ncbi:hypothetical protein C8F04DRAFT_1289914 [Mycena alexandri]|uniref:Uncharacterized protein n=1 Tax=Mycena alexandri TaxID=1745969 RepID=A0AAD6XAI2_9AGAR|nr:hypothetical protein C8F04DRAFT_1289914 [Mycena alexandri]
MEHYVEFGNYIGNPWNYGDLQRGYPYYGNYMNYSNYRSSPDGSDSNMDHPSGIGGFLAHPQFSHIAAIDIHICPPSEGGIRKFIQHPTQILIPARARPRSDSNMAYPSSIGGFFWRTPQFNHTAGAERLGPFSAGEETRLDCHLDLVGDFAFDTIVSSKPNTADAAKPRKASQKAKTAADAGADEMDIDSDPVGSNPCSSAPSEISHEESEDSKSKDGDDRALCASGISNTSAKVSPTIMGAWMPLSVNLSARLQAIGLPGRAPAQDLKGKLSNWHKEIRRNRTPKIYPGARLEDLHITCYELYRFTDPLAHLFRSRSVYVRRDLPRYAPQPLMKCRGCGPEVMKPEESRVAGTPRKHHRRLPRALPPTKTKQTKSSSAGTSQPASRPPSSQTTTPTTDKVPPSTSTSNIVTKVHVAGVPARPRATCIPPKPPRRPQGAWTTTTLHAATPRARAPSSPSRTWKRSPGEPRSSSVLQTCAMKISTHPARNWTSTRNGHDSTPKGSIHSRVLVLALAEADARPEAKRHDDATIPRVHRHLHHLHRLAHRLDHDTVSRSRPADADGRRHRAPPRTRPRTTIPRPPPALESPHGVCSRILPAKTSPSGPSLPKKTPNKNRKKTQKNLTAQRPKHLVHARPPLASVPSLSRLAHEARVAVVVIIVGVGVGVGVGGVGARARHAAADVVGGEGPRVGLAGGGRGRGVGGGEDGAEERVQEP